MPCFVTGTAEGDATLAASEASAEATKVTEMLCALMGQLESGGVLGHLNHVPGLDEWWTNHKRIDAEREKREAEALEREVQRAKERLAQAEAKLYSRR